MTMTHYPVTPSFWRGVWSVFRVLPGRLRRACDWQRLGPGYADLHRPTCGDCAAYKANLIRLRRAPGWMT